MTGIEKGVIAGILIMLAAMVGSCAVIGYSVHQSGGLKAVIIEAGREIKDIAREIAKD